MLKQMITVAALCAVAGCAAEDNYTLTTPYRSDYRSDNMAAAEPGWGTCDPSDAKAWSNSSGYSNRSTDQNWRATANPSDSDAWRNSSGYSKRSMDQNGREANPSDA